MVSYCCVILHFFDDIFPDLEYLLICFLFPLLYIFFTKVSVSIFGPLCNQIFFFLSSFKDSLYNIF